MDPGTEPATPPRPALGDGQSVSGLDLAKPHKSVGHRAALSKQSFPYLVSYNSLDDSLKKTIRNVA